MHFVASKTDRVLSKRLVPQINKVLPVCYSYASASPQRQVRFNFQRKRAIRYPYSYRSRTPATSNKGESVALHFDF